MPRRERHQLQSASTGSLAKLTRVQRSESLIGNLPAGNAPSFLYLTIAPTGSAALALRASEERHRAQPDRRQLVVRAKANAAWIVVSLAGRLRAPPLAPSSSPA